jgi:acyl carrier protein
MEASCTIGVVVIDDVGEKLSQVFRLVLDRPDDADVSSTRRISEPRWDSLANATLIVALESEFGIKLDAHQIERLTSYQATLLLIKEKSG